MTRSSTPRRAAATLLSLPLTAIVALAPLPALADGSIADAGFQLRAPMTPMTTGMKLRGFVSLQDPEAGGEVAPAPEADPSAPPPTAAPAPYPPPPVYGPPPPQSAPPPRGLGMLISGSVVAGAVGLPFTILGVYTIAAARTAGDIAGGVEGEAVSGLGTITGGVLVVFGLIGLGVGISLATVGGIRLGKYNRWKAGQPQTARLLPHSGRTAHGTWTTGFSLQF